MLLLLVGGGWSVFNAPGPGYPRYIGGVGLLVFILFILLGWKVFGPPIS